MTSSLLLADPASSVFALQTLLLALAADCVGGEYHAALHPVVWLGKGTNALLRLAPRVGWYRQFFFGVGLTTCIVVASGAATWFVIRGSAEYPILQIGVGAFLLKASFALRELGAAAMRVIRPVKADKLSEARAALASLCSRDASDLSKEELLAATIESLAENASDSFVAPLFYFLLFGVPGAVAYRAINTLDAMIGYRGNYEALGKCAARLDDFANLVPARLTALLFLVAGRLGGGNVAQGRRILFRDGGKTPSPNAGRPMAAMAGLLGVKLDKRGVYSLGDASVPVTPAKVRDAWRIVLAACWGMSAACALLLLWHSQRFFGQLCL